MGQSGWLFHLINGDVWHGGEGSPFLPKSRQIHLQSPVHTAAGKSWISSMGKRASGSPTILSRECRCSPLSPGRLAISMIFRSCRSSVAALGANEESVRGEIRYICGFKGECCVQRAVNSVSNMRWRKMVTRGSKVTSKTSRAKGTEVWPRTVLLSGHRVMGDDFLLHTSKRSSTDSLSLLGSCQSITTSSPSLTSAASVPSSSHINTDPPAVRSSSNT